MSVSPLPQRSLAALSGAATGSTCKIGVFSQYPQDTVLSINGRSVTLSMTVCGADAAGFYPGTIGVQQAGYYAHYLITDLSKSRQYNYRVTQAGTAEGDLSFDGRLMTSPDESDNFAVILYSCSGQASYPGGWGFAKRYASGDRSVNPDGLPVAAMLGVDDTVYIDSFGIDDTGYPIPHKTTDPATIETEYNPCAKWMSQLGMMHNTGAAGSGVSTGREEARTWCNDNINQLAIWGDHEVFNDVGYAPTSGTYRQDGITADQTVTRFKACEVAWDIFRGWLNGEHFNPTGDESTPSATGRSRGWGHELGPLQILCIDRNYGDMSDVEGNGRFIMSQAQIDGAVAQLAASEARFRILGSAHRYRFSPAAPENEISGDDNAVLGLFSNQTMSLMKKHNLDGSKWIMFRGDNHGIEIAQHGRATAGREAEEFVEYNYAGMRNPKGTMSLGDVIQVYNGWFDFVANDYLPPVGVGVLPEYRGLFDNSQDATTTKLGNIWNDEEEGICVLVEVFAKEVPKRMSVSLIWAGKNKRQLTHHYYDDGGANLPEPKRSMGTR